MASMFFRLYPAVFNDPIVYSFRAFAARFALPTRRPAYDLGPRSNVIVAGGARARSFCTKTAGLGPE